MLLLLLMIIFDGHNIRSSGGRTTKEIPCDYYYYHISCALGKVKSKRPRLRLLALVERTWTAQVDG